MAKRIDGTTPLWIAAGTLLGERGEDFFRCVDKTLVTFDHEDIHDLRVSSRRLREGLSLFSPCYPRNDLQLLTKKIRQVTRMSGDIRNTDEAMLFFTALADELDGACRSDLDRLLQEFRRKRNKGIRALATGLRKSVPRSLRGELKETVGAPLLFRASGNGADLLAPVAEFARTALAGRLAEVVALAPEARQPGRSEAQHLLRIALKHWRYRLEILSFAAGVRYRDIHAAVKRYQEVLGKMHDLDVFAGIAEGAEFPSCGRNRIIEVIRAKRDAFFSDFSGLLEKIPLERIGEQMNEALKDPDDQFPGTVRSGTQTAQ